jgi:hypothetical protein
LLQSLVSFFLLLCDKLVSGVVFIDIRDISYCLQFAVEGIKLLSEHGKPPARCKIKP